VSARSRYEIKVVHDSIEVVDLDDGEVVLFWDCLPRERRRMSEALRADLVRLDPGAFLRRWSQARPEEFG
jgi:hypothetical protein